YSEYIDDDPVGYWRDYLEDLEALPAAQRRLAQGLVWLRLASHYLEHASRLRGCRCGADHLPDIERVQRQAEDAFASCMAAAPEYAQGYIVAAKFYQSCERMDEAAGVYGRLLEHVPDHPDAVTELATHHLRHGKAQQALHHALRARQLKPLDQATGELLWSAHMAVARELAQSGRYDEARKEMATAGRVLPERANRYDVLARKAVLELKAGDAGAARRLIEQAQGGLEEPTALWLAMALEARRYQLPSEDVWLYEKRWMEALKRRCRSSTAGMMCRLIAAERAVPEPLADIKLYSLHLAEYVRRAWRTKWKEPDLREACGLLAELKEWKLLSKFARSGIRKFPDTAYFHLLRGIEELSKTSVWHKRKRTVEYFRRAIELASNSDDPRDRVVLEEANRYLHRAESPTGHGRPLPDRDEEPEDDAGGEVVVGGPLDGLPIEIVRDIVERACAKFGLDPEEVISELADGRPD
ncbi:MAG: tetratricopeptide repeat protein, partial [Thermoguttaceae bacterium]